MNCHSWRRHIVITYWLINSIVIMLWSAVLYSLDGAISNTLLLCCLILRGQMENTLQCTWVISQSQYNTLCELHYVPSWTHTHTHTHTDTDRTGEQNYIHQNGILFKPLKKLVVSYYFHSGILIYFQTENHSEHMVSKKLDSKWNLDHPSGFQQEGLRKEWTQPRVECDL